jgi:hypothetical protein
VQTSDSRFSFISRHLQLLLSRREREVGEKETSCKFPQLYCSFLYQITKFAARDVLTPPLSRRLGVSFYWGFVQLVPVENERNLFLLQWSTNRGSRQQFFSLPGSEKLIF